MNSEEWVKQLFKYCDENNINPWDFDFKQCYVNEKLDESKPKLPLILQYKSYLLKDKNEKFNITGKTGKEADCDKESFHIYKILNWQKDPNDQIRGDSMNSFVSTFNRLISVNLYKDVPKKNVLAPFSVENAETLKSEYGEIPKIADLNSRLIQNPGLLKKFHFSEGNKSRIQSGETKVDLIEEIEKFSRLTHSFGNYIVMLSWMNTGRGNALSSTKDYWDLTLKDLHHYFLSIDDKIGELNWQKFIKKYYLQPFVNKNFIVQELWNEHFNVRTYPKEISDFEQFYHNINLLIEERGKWMTKKLCDKLQLQNFNFYKKHLANMEEIKFFDEIIK